MKNNVQQLETIMKQKKVCTYEKKKKKKIGIREKMEEVW